MEPIPPDDFLHQWGRWPDEDGPWAVGVHLAPVDGRLECVGLEVWAVPPPEGREDDLSVAQEVGAELQEHPVPIRSTEVRRIAPDALIRQAIDDWTDAAEDAIEMHEWLQKRNASVRAALGTYVAEDVEVRRRGADGEWVQEHRDSMVVGGAADAARDEQALRSARRRLKQLASGRSRGGRPVLFDAEHYAQVAEVYNRAVAFRQHPTKTVAEHFDYTPTKAAKHVQKARALGFDLTPPSNLGQFQPRRR